MELGDFAGHEGFAVEDVAAVGGGFGGADFAADFGPVGLGELFVGLHGAEAFADDFAGGLVLAALHFGADEAFELVGEGDAEGCFSCHGGIVRLPRECANRCYGLGPVSKPRVGVARLRAARAAWILLAAS